MKRFASEVGLDREQFDSCLENNKYEEYVKADLDYALSSRFYMTPTFVVMKSDGSEAEVVLGAQPYNSLRTIIDKKLT